MDKGDRIGDINVIRKALFSLLEFLEPPGEIALPVIAIITKSKVSFRQVGVKRESMIERNPWLPPVVPGLDRVLASN